MKGREGIVEHIGIGIESIGGILVCIMCRIIRSFVYKAGD